jgi:hypothetical protein
VTIRGSGQTQRLSWERLSAAAEQDDAELRPVYAALLAEALRMAAERKLIRVTTRNQSGHCLDLGAHTWAAELRDLAGRFVSGRLVSADFGQTGVLAYAEADAERAGEVLSGRGWTVR